MEPINLMVNNNPLDDMTEWKHKEEIAYWKSLATSLYYEKKMLENHLRDVYVDLINKHLECTCTVMKDNKPENELDGVMNYTVNQNVEERSKYIKKSRQYKKPMYVEPVSQPFDTVMTYNDDGATKVIHSSQSPSVNQRGQHKKKLKEVRESFMPVPVFKNRSEEMKELYGTHKSQIAGVETALQLNFEHARCQLKPSFWPELQLNLG